MVDTINIVSKEVSREHNIDEDLVKFVNDFFFKCLKSVIQSGEYTSIRVNNIGTLVTSRLKINTKIKKLIKLIRNIKDPSKVYKEKNKEDVIKDKYRELKLLLKRRNELAIAYETNRLNRIENKIKNQKKYESNKMAEISLGE